MQHSIPSALRDLIPEPVLHFARSVAARIRRPSERYREAYRTTQDALRATEYAGSDEIARVQLERMREIMVHAYERVPWYRETFKAAAVDPHDIERLADVAEFPTTQKEDMRDNLEAFLSRGFSPDRVVYSTTGGSTGLPLGFYRERDVASAVEHAFIDHIWRRVSCHLGVRNVALRGWAPPSKRLYTRKPNALVLSSYHLTPEHMATFVRMIRRFCPQAIQCYPSAGQILARYMLERGEPPFSGLKAVLCGSETIYPGQRDLLRQALGARVFTWYGLSEQCALAAECEQSSVYHVEPLYGFVELLPMEPNLDAGTDGLCEIVATGFWNRPMPFIRYRTKDLARRTEGTCQCGRSHMLLAEVAGRLQELIVTGTGRLISMTAINMHDDVFDGVKQLQFRQSRPGMLTLDYVPKPGFSDEDIPRIRQALLRKLGDDTELELQGVDSIPRAPSGKAQWLVQEIDVQEVLSPERQRDEIP